METGSNKIYQLTTTLGHEALEELIGNFSVDNGTYLNINVLFKANLINSKTTIVIDMKLLSMVTRCCR